MKRAILGVLAAVVVYGQKFEVASIKPSPPPAGTRIRVEMDGGPGTGDPLTFICRNCSLAMLVMQAYDVKYFQIAGLDSRSSELYEIAAKVPEGTTKDQFRVMLQNLLADRFKMTLHRDMRQMPAYDLIVAKNGPRLKESGDAAASKDSALPAAATKTPTFDRDGFPILPPGRGGMISVNGRARMQGVHETMEELASWISNQLDMPVIDSTGLQGKYDFSLYWTGGADDSGPGMVSAIQSQLGLKLDLKKAPMVFVVVDHIDSAPSEN